MLAGECNGVNMAGRGIKRAAACLCAIILTNCVHAQYQSQARDQTSVLQHDRSEQGDGSVQILHSETNATLQFRHLGRLHVSTKKCNFKHLRCRPGQPTIDMSHYKKIYVKCTTPTTQTSPTSPIFDTYLADLAATYTAANPLLLTGECVPMLCTFTAS